MDLSKACHCVLKLHRDDEGGGLVCQRSPQLVLPPGVPPYEQLFVYMCCCCLIFLFLVFLMFFLFFISLSSFLPPLSATFAADSGELCS